jgi:drug/metabolite transporter (DMT)-like permease
MLQQLRLSPVTLAGALLAFHFALWVTSLSMTSVLSSLVFVTMNPLFVAVLDLALFRERTSRLLWAAVAIVTAGGVFIGLQSGTTANVGNLLALGGALAASLYLIVGRRASRAMDPLSYNVGAFGWAAVLMGVVCLVAGRPLLPLSGTSFLWLAVTALLGQTVGHGLINASLKSFQPQFVALMLLWEPILGSLLAFLVLGDRPGPAELVGGAVILAGLALGIVASRSAAEGPAGTEA